MKLTRLHYTVGAVAIGTLLAVLLFNRQGYGEISPKAYEYAKALYSICNRQDTERLETISKMIATSQAAGEVSGDEFRWLQDIVERARNDDWETATLHSRQMLEDQVH